MQTAMNVRLVNGEVLMLPDVIDLDLGNKLNWHIFSCANGQIVAVPDASILYITERPIEDEQ